MPTPRIPEYEVLSNTPDLVLLFGRQAWSGTPAFVAGKGMTPTNPGAGQTVASCNGVLAPFSCVGFLHPAAGSQNTVDGRLINQTNVTRGENFRVKNNAGTGQTEDGTAEISMVMCTHLQKRGT